MVNKLLHVIFHIRNKYIRNYGPKRALIVPSAPLKKNKGNSCPLPPLSPLVASKEVVKEEEKVAEEEEEEE